jgi:hypothetical protein
MRLEFLYRSPFTFFIVTRCRNHFRYHSGQGYQSDKRRSKDRLTQPIPARRSSPYQHPTYRGNTHCPDSEMKRARTLGRKQPVDGRYCISVWHYYLRCNGGIGLGSRWHFLTKNLASNQ